MIILVQVLRLTHPVWEEITYLFLFGSVPSPLYIKPHISRHQLEKYINLELSKLRLYQPKHIPSEIVPHVYSAVRYLGVIIENMHFIQ